jgi:hypothetical protein
MPTIKFGDTEYSVPKLNIGQLEEVTAAFDLPAMRRPFAILRIALKRADPKVADPNAIEATNDEIADAVMQILQSSGFGKATDPNGAAPGQPGTADQVAS